MRKLSLLLLFIALPVLAIDPHFGSFLQLDFTTNNYTIGIRTNRFVTRDFLSNYVSISSSFTTNLITTNNNVGITNLIISISGTNGSTTVVNLITTNNNAGITNLILGVATNTAVAAGTNVTVTTNVSGNYIIYTIAGQPRVPISLVTNIFTTNASNTQITNDIRNIVGTNAYVVAGTNITVQTNGTTYTVNASVPTVTTNIVSTNTSGGVTNVVLSIVTNAFPQGNGVSNKIAYWVNTNQLGSAVIQQTSTNLLEYFNTASPIAGSDTNSWLTNRFYGYYSNATDFNAIELYAFGNGNTSTNGAMILQRGPGAGHQNTLTFGANNFPWWTIDGTSGSFTPMTQAGSSGTGQNLGSATHAIAKITTDRIKFKDEEGPALLIANIEGPTGSDPAMSWNSGYINFQPTPTTGATISYGSDGRLYIGSGSSLIFNSVGSTALGIQFATNGPSARMGFTILTNGFRDQTNLTALSSKDVVICSYVSLNGSGASVWEDQSHRTNGQSTRFVSSNSSDTNAVSWLIIRIYP